jgi:hypothetical protein
MISRIIFGVIMDNNWLRLCVEIMGDTIEYHWGNSFSMKRFNELSLHAIALVSFAYSDNIHDLSPYTSLVMLCNNIGYGYRYNGDFETCIKFFKKPYLSKKMFLGNIVYIEQPCTIILRGRMMN